MKASGKYMSTMAKSKKHFKCSDIKITEVFQKVRDINHNMSKFMRIIAELMWQSPLSGVRTLNKKNPI